jgi:hypothetical protein
MLVKEVHGTFTKQRDSWHCKRSSMNNTCFTDNQVQKRLLAFALVTLHMEDEDWSRPMFEEKYIPMCEASFGNDSGCVDFAGSDQGIIIQNRSWVDVYRMSRCVERTRIISRHDFRSEYKESNSTESGGGGSSELLPLKQEH